MKQLSTANYAKTWLRLQKGIEPRHIATHQKKRKDIWNWLCHCARQLGITTKVPIAAACFAAGLCFATPAVAQITFTLRTGAANPFNGVDIGGYSVPTFTDIDGDGDMDAFIGEGGGAIVYYQNTGTSTVPAFTLQSGAANPFNGVNVGGYSTPTFTDIDGDGDRDAFIGTVAGTIVYYQNTGTPTVPTFTEQTGAANPFNGVDIGDYSTPTFTDIDGDGDMDAFTGTAPGAIRYYQNTGTPTVPAFTEQTGAANPFNGVDVGGYSTPTFTDIDGDGDRDAFIGEEFGVIIYYQNTGTPTVPAFTLQSGAANPFNGEDVGGEAMPTFADIDGDGDMDAFIGEATGTIVYYENTTPLVVLPLQLVSFSGSSHTGYNQLQWQTANEVNTKVFEIERSSDSRNFTRIASVNTTGNSNNLYSARDNVTYTGKLFYRLKMLDIDGRFTFSHTIYLNSDQAAAISIYPNPAKEVININRGNASILRTTAHVYDVNGRLMQNILITNNQQQIILKAFLPGMYTIKFADGAVHRFIKR